nr:MAG TPA: hypothetical protein [Caudoviricetes sp.]
MALRLLSKMPKYLAFLVQHFSATISPKQAKSPDIQGFFSGGAGGIRTPYEVANSLSFLAQR